MQQRKSSPKILIAIALGPICAVAADLPAQDLIWQPANAPVPVVQKGAPRELETRYSAEAMALAARPEKTVRRTSATPLHAVPAPGTISAGFDGDPQLLSQARPHGTRLQFSAEPTSQGP